MNFTQLLTLFTLLPLLTITQADPHTQSLHPKQLHSTPPHRRHPSPNNNNDEPHLTNRNTIIASTSDNLPRDRKVLVRRKKRANCQVPVGVNTTNAIATGSGSSSGGEYSSSVVVDSSSTSTSSSVAPVATSTSTSTGDTGSLMGRLFPVGEGNADWTTCTDDSDALSFSAALKPLSAGILPSTATSPDGQSSLIANYPANTYHYSSSTGHGYSFYTEGTHANVLVEGAKEVLFSYSIFFPSGFQFNKGGKLPGLYGGTDLDTAKSCSGGRQDGRDSCFSARLMWRTNGMGEIYNYYPGAVYDDAAYCATGPMSVCDKVYGDSIGRGAFTFATGEWTTVSQRLKLNDVGASNGEQELFVNGVSTIKLDGLEISVDSATKIYGIMAQTFFGGSDATWASPVDQSAYFKDWSLAVLA